MLQLHTKARAVHAVTARLRSHRQRLCVRCAHADGSRTQSAVTAQEQRAPAMVKVVLVVAVALFNGKGQVLLAQRPEGKAMAGLWEFPGGKIDEGETPEAALCRELQEELSIHVLPQDLKPITFASHSYEKFHLLMPLFGCYRWQGEVHGAEGQQLAWVLAEQLKDYPMPAADNPLVAPVTAAMTQAQ